MQIFHDNSIHSKVMIFVNPQILPLGRQNKITWRFGCKKPGLRAGNKPNVKKMPEAGHQWPEVSIWECADTTTTSRR